MIPRNKSNYPLYNGRAKNSVAHITHINFQKIWFAYRNTFISQSLLHHITSTSRVLMRHNLFRNTQLKRLFNQICFHGRNEHYRSTRLFIFSR